MRPKSIVNFERVVLASLALGAIAAFLGWERTAAELAALGAGTGLAIGTLVAVVVITLLLLWFIAHKASPVAKWIYVVFAVLGFIGSAFNLGELTRLPPVEAVITISQYVLSIVALWLLFRPDANSWFADGRGDAAPDDFR